MKITCSRDLLHEGVNNVLKAVASKSAVPALEGIFLKCNTNSLTLTGYDLELGITQTISCNVFRQGEIVLNAKVFSEMVRNLDSEEITIEKTDDLIVNIISGMTEYTIMGISAEDYPILPDAENQNKIILPQIVLKSMIKKTLFAVSQDLTKPILTGILLEANDNNLSLVSCDGCRLAVCKENINFSGNENPVIPAKTFSELLKMLKDEEDEIITISVGKKHVSFFLNNCVVISRLIEGTFIDYTAVIPKEIQTTVSISTRKFQKTIEKTSLILTEKIKSSVKLNFKDDKIKASCKTALGNANDEIPAAMEGEPCVIGFNSKYLSDALRACEEENIILQFNGSSSPMKIMPSEGENFLFLVMPVMLK